MNKKENKEKKADETSTNKGVEGNRREAIKQKIFADSSMR